jgi:hypothetical protein
MNNNTSVKTEVTAVTSVVTAVVKAVRQNNNFGGRFI